MWLRLSQIYWIWFGQEFTHPQERPFAVLINPTSFVGSVWSLLWVVFSLMLLVWAQSIDKAAVWRQLSGR